METPFSLQPILGTDKRNPSFTVYRDVAQQQLQVYYGAELFECVPDDRHHPEFKLLLARLYQVGIRTTTLSQAFGVDGKTLRRWAAALRSGDPHRLVRVLAGRHHRRKLTPEVRTYLEMRFDPVYTETPSIYNRRLRTEVRQVFKLNLSAESVRQVCQPLKQRMKTVEVPSLPRVCSGEGDCAPLVAVEVLASEKAAVPDPAGFPDRKIMPVLNHPPAVPAPSGLRFVHRLGVLLLSSILHAMNGVDASGGWILKQWLAAILLGAVNIEQTKLLDLDDLGQILGRTLLPQQLQRQQLSRLAQNEKTATQLSRWNAAQVQVAEQTDFYYDPHAKPYSGELKILRGWCSSKHFADKVLFMDFIHTGRAEPVYVEYTDNYLDLRERFAPTIRRFRSTLEISPSAVLSLVLDRGIYSQDVFDQLREDPHLHFITWEKNYQPPGWVPALSSGTFVMTRPRNDAHDLRLYRFEHLDQDWKKDPRLRQLRVRATNPKGQSIELGVLTDDRQRSAEAIIRLIFRRWIQENDFKYLEKHFGINPITSYASIPYRQLQNPVEEKQMRSGAYRALEKQCREVAGQIKTLLLKEHQYPGKSPGRVQQIQLLDQRLAELHQQLQQTQKEVSRLEWLIRENYRRLDTGNKRVMDALKLIARNAFYRALQPFKKLYDNFRDDHALFRNLTRADGLLVGRPDGSADIHLFPTAHYPPALRQIVTDVLKQINQTTPVMPDGSGRHIRFFLGEKTGIGLAIGNPPP